MSAKTAVNSFLSRATGYHLTKGAPGEARRQAAGRGQKSAPAAASTTPVAASTKSTKPAKVRKTGGGFPSDYDEADRKIIRAVQGFTMTGNDKLYALISATRYVARYDIPGDVVECGVWRGGSMHAVARTLTQCGDQNRDLYLFDTFEGMPEPSEHDVRHDGAPAADLLATQDKSRPVWAVASLEDVRAGFDNVPYPAERLHFVKGRVEDTVPAQVPERISILRLDTDWYESTAHELVHMWDRLVPGGVLMIDDYGHWKGSRRATDEFLDRTGAPLLLLRMNSGRVAIKR